METSNANTQGARASTEPDVDIEVPRRPVTTKWNLQAIKGKIAKIPKHLRKLNVYEWWFNLSTRRRASRRARKDYKEVIKTASHNLWDDTVDDYGDQGLDGQPTIPPPPPLEMPGFETNDNWDHLWPNSGLSVMSDEASSGTSSGPTCPKPVFSRGGRAKELAYAVELHFGKLPYDKANYETARRFASRHDLVSKSSVRYAHRAALVKRAMQLYFVATENDLVDHFILDNAKNAKRTKQLGLSMQ